MPSSLRLHDVLIIGGGPAGLSVALGLARQHKSCVVFSDSKFRNEGAAAMHSVASRDGERPAEFRRITREQIVKYGNTTFVDITVISVCKEHVDGYDGYKATDVNGEEWTGKKLVLATGSQDIGPNIEGYAENWPHNIYQCLFCDGHERSHLPKGILTFPSSSYLKLAQMAASISAKNSMVTIFTHGPPGESADVQQALKKGTALGINIENRRIQRLQYLPEGLNVVFEDSEEVYMGFLVYSPESVPAASHLISSLGLEMADTPIGRIVKRGEPFGATNVNGVFVCGDAGVAMKQVTQAMAQGNFTAGGIVFDLHNEEADAALAAYEDRHETRKISSIKGMNHEESILPVAA